MSDSGDAVDLGFNPYESPRGVSSAEPAVRSRSRFQSVYKSAHLRAMTAVVLLGIMVFVNVLGVINNIKQYQLLEDARRGQIDRAEGEANDVRYNATQVVEAFLYFVIAVPYLMWTYRAYKNLPALGAKNLEH